MLNPEFYADKFDKVFIVSPSALKLSLDIPKEDINNRFNLAWIFDKIHTINQ
jgi:hypothetical protein